MSLFYDEKYIYPGCPIRVSRGLYYHVGIYLGQRGGVDCVIHFNGEPGLGKSKARVRIDTWDDFRRGKSVEIHKEIADKASFSPKVILERATSQLGKGGFSLLFNNCEHFVSRCVAGENRSRQVDTGFAVASFVTIFALLAKA